MTLKTLKDVYKEQEICLDLLGREQSKKDIGATFSKLKYEAVKWFKAFGDEFGQENLKWRFDRQGFIQHFFNLTKGDLK